MREVITAFRCLTSQTNENQRVGMIACPPLPTTQCSHLHPGYWFFGDFDIPVGSFGRIPAAFPPKPQQAACHGGVGLSAHSRPAMPDRAARSYPLRSRWKQTQNMHQEPIRVRN